MRIIVDGDRCEMNAVCILQAPNIFGFADDDTLRITGEVTDDNEDEVRNAVFACPKSALSLRTDNDDET